MTKNNYIHKKPYMTPLILFEEIEQEVGVLKDAASIINVDTDTGTGEFGGEDAKAGFIFFEEDYEEIEY